MAKTNGEQKGVVVTPPQRAGHDGEFRWVRAAALTVDKEYQRFVSRKSVDRIVREYDPNVFGVILCSQRDAVDIAILDGQHRWEASIELFGDGVLVPCFLMRGLTAVDEASIFWKMNRNRLPPSSADTFRARLAANEPIAMKIRDIVDELGVELQLYPQPLAANQVGAFSALEELYRDGSIVPVLSLIRASWPKEHGVLKASNLAGFQQFFRIFHNEFFLDKRWSEERMDRLQSVMALELPRDIERRAAVYQESLNTRKSTAMARSLYWYYQRNLKATSKLRLPPWSVDADDVRLVALMDEAEDE